MEESTRVINYHVEQEANAYLRRTIPDEDSEWQSRSVPIPRLPNLKTQNSNSSMNETNFMGRLAVAMKALTDWRYTIFAPESAAWLDADGSEIAGAGTFVELNNAVSVAGLRGLDKLFAFFVQKQLKKVVELYDVEVALLAELPHEIISVVKRIQKTKLRQDANAKEYPQPMRELMRTASNDLRPFHKLVGKKTRHYYDATSSKGHRLLWKPLTDFIHDIGQAQLIRQKISNELQFRCQLDSSLLNGAAESLNKALLSDVRKYLRDPTNQPAPMPKGSDLIPNFAELMSNIGRVDPLSTIYVTSRTLEHLPLMLALFTIAISSKLKYSPKFASSIRANESVEADGYVLAVGLVTVLKQFHPSYLRIYLDALSQFIRSNVHYSFSLGSSSGDVRIVLFHFDLICLFCFVLGSFYFWGYFILFCFVYLL